MTIDLLITQDVMTLSGPALTGSYFMSPGNVRLLKGYKNHLGQEAGGFLVIGKSTTYQHSFSDRLAVSPPGVYSLTPKTVNLRMGGGTTLQAATYHFTAYTGKNTLKQQTRKALPTTYALTGNTTIGDLSVPFGLSSYLQTGDDATLTYVAKNYILTEGGDRLETESGDFLQTETGSVATSH